MKTYGAGQSAVKALNGVSLEIRKGEPLVILGSSGSGKTIEITENDQPVPAERIEW
jgi:ABC-type lipoprotein export system ATPase subunit